MNQDVPQPATATRSPGAGSEPATSAASRAACRQQAGCEATSCAVRLPAVMSSCVTDSSSLSVQPVHVPASPVAATERMK